MIAVIATNRNTASAIADALGAERMYKEYFEGDFHLVTWIDECPIVLVAADERRNASTTDSVLPVSHRFRRIIRQKQTPNGMVTDKNAVRRLKAIDEVLERCESVVVATAPDGEGERTFGYVYDYLGYTKPVRRLRMSELT